MIENEEILFIKFFGNRLKEIRLKNNLSQENLANDADIPINQVGRIERAEIYTSLKTFLNYQKP
ncbi:MAG: helix-turn-helix domain-containing protein [Flavobacteriaceae bacterium]|nr:helix-turn-helix domain-containing protein [Flavobacteriaceae bacterium]